MLRLKVFRSPGLSIYCLNSRLGVTSWRLRPYPAYPPILNPTSVIRRCPSHTFVESSRLYSPAIPRLTVFRMADAKLPSFWNDCAQ